jgi:delta-1-pyrroline-5-carboxylate synthetase
VQVGTLFNAMFAEALAIKDEQAKRIERATGIPAAQTAAGLPDEMAKAAREQSRTLAALPSEDRAAILLRIADALESRIEEIMAANQRDLTAATGNIDEQLLQRLVLKPKKVAQLADGIRQLANMDEPIGNILSRTEIAEVRLLPACVHEHGCAVQSGRSALSEGPVLDRASCHGHPSCTPCTVAVQGMELTKVTSPIGVVLIIFEARPDALPQIASLAIRSGNGLLLKGGKEAQHSNACLHSIIMSCLAPACGPGLIGLVTSRSEIDELLRLKEYIDLVVPRGSNKLVSYIQNHTSIPVLGHADGICHIYIDEKADLGQVCRPVLGLFKPLLLFCKLALRAADAPMHVRASHSPDPAWTPA